MLGLLGATCCEPVSIWIRDFPSDLTCAIQRFLLSHLEEEQVSVIVSRSDLSGLIHKDSKVVLAVVDPLRTRRGVGQEALWSIARRGGSRTPAVVLASESGPAGAPGALLEIRRSRDELARTLDWLLSRPEPDPRIRAYFSRLPGNPIAISHSYLDPVIAPCAGSAIWRPRTLRSRDIQYGLLAGSAVLRTILANADAWQEIAASHEDYCQVYSFLRGPAVGVPEEASDRLLEAMVSRSNLYLEQVARRASGDGFKQGREGFSSRVFRRSNPAAHPDRGISLRLLSDLGSGGSKPLESLIDAVVQSGDIGRIRSMGLDRDLSDEHCRRGIRREELRGMLLLWTYKQVYTRFDTLRRQGFIEWERESGNGALRFYLPEALQGLPAEFTGLPSPEQVKRLTESRSTCLPGSDHGFPNPIVTRNH
jgi:hypothetical protein